jgi:hypothetical protein
MPFDQPLAIGINDIDALAAIDQQRAFAFMQAEIGLRMDVVRDVAREGGVQVQRHLHAPAHG